MLKNTTILIISVVGGCVCCCDHCTKEKDNNPEQPPSGPNVSGNPVEDKKTLMIFIEKDCPLLRQTVASISNDFKTSLEKLLSACAPFFSQYIQALDANYKNVDDEVSYDGPTTRRIKLGFMKKLLGDNFANMVSESALDLGSSVSESEVSLIKQCVKKEVLKEVINKLNIFQQIGTGNSSLLKNFCKNLDNANDISNNRKILLLLYLMLKIDEGEITGSSVNYVAIKKDACNCFTHVLTNNAGLTPDDVAMYICILLNRNIDRIL